MTPSGLLADILARVDALFLAPRHYRGGRPFPLRAMAGVDEKRQSYLAGDGLAFLIGGDSAERKQGERLLDELRELGTIELVTRGGRRSGLWLTEAGDSVARSLVATDDIRHAWRLLTLLAELAATTRMSWAGQRWVREATLTDRQGTSLAGIEFASLPLKLRGLIVDGIDQEGRVCYSLTAAGREAAEHEPPQAPDRLPEMVEQLADEYTTKLRRHCDERATWKPEAPGRLYVPLPVSYPPLREPAR